MKLISMVDFVLQHKEADYLFSKPIEEAYTNIRDYANFLNQPLTLGMFVPCWGGKIIREPSNTSHIYEMKMDRYEEGKRGVLFEGAVYLHEPHPDHDVIAKINFPNGTMVFLTKNGHLLDGEFFGIETIQELGDYDFTLTKSAIKQLGL